MEQSFITGLWNIKIAAGTNIVTTKKYSDLIMQAGITSGVSPYFLAARIKQEVGPFLSHNSISGTVSGYEGLYNFYNIGATSNPDYMQVIKNGLQYAKDGKGANQEAKDKYLIPWNTKEKSITGGAIFIGSSYINVGQNSIYLQKFDVNDQRSNELFWHQYMTNVLAPYSESKIVYTGYANSGLLNAPMSFVIPVYNNMPAIMQDSPSISPSDFTDDSTKMYPNISTVLNIRTGPGTSYEIITTVSKTDTLTRIKKGKQSGDLWDKVILSNGIIGYVFQNYLLPVSNIEHPPDEPIEKPGEEELIVFENPEDIFSPSLKIDGNIITGLNYLDTTVKSMRDKINSNYVVEFYNYKNELLNDTESLGTGSKIVFRDDGNNIAAEYHIVLYGDVNRRWKNKQCRFIGIAKTYT